MWGLMHVDERVAWIASRQYGAISHGQALACGHGRDAITSRLRRGLLHPLYRAVYLVGHAVPPPLAREAGAILACGEGAVLSHASAAALYGLVAERPHTVHVTVAGRDARRRGIHVHRTARLLAGAVLRQHGLPVTSPQRTITDLADTAPAAVLENAIAEARRRRLITEVEIAPGRKGAARLRAIAAEGARLTRSEAERRLLALIRSAGLSPPETNVRIGRHEVDFLWRAERLVVEVDGFAFHGDRAAFERDRHRDATLQGQGFRVTRLTWRQITQRPEAVVATLAAALAR